MLGQASDADRICTHEPGPYVRAHRALVLVWSGSSGAVRQAGVDAASRALDAHIMITNGPRGEAEADDDRSVRPASGRVVVVDDDPVLVDALRDVLREEGYVVEGFTEAASALDRLCNGEKPSLVLLDYVMPTMNGAEFVEALEGAGVDVPIIMLSAMSDAYLPAAHVARVIKKPFELDTLLDELARLRGSTPPEKGGRAA